MLHSGLKTWNWSRLWVALYCFHKTLGQRGTSRAQRLSGVGLVAFFRKKGWGGKIAVCLYQVLCERHSQKRTADLVEISSGCSLLLCAQSSLSLASLVYEMSFQVLCTMLVSLTGCK
jgi:hypothetical protein